MLLLPIVLLAATLPVCAERQHTAVVAAREAARALAAQWPAADPQRAEQIVREVAADHDVNPSDVRLHIRAAGARRGDVVVVDVDVVMPAIEVAGIGAGSWRYTARATRRIDDFRSR